MQIWKAGLVGAAALLASSGSAFAIDCAKAAKVAEKLICADKALVEADTALNKAYESLVAAAPDEATRELLATSQKRWIESRDSEIEASANNTNEDNFRPERSLSERLALMIGGRTDALKQSATGENPLLVNLKTQKEVASKYSGGDFAGMDTGCFFLPPDDSYGCFSTRYYQNKERICAQDEYWATGSVYVQRYVADLVDGKPKVIASCSFNGQDSACPGSLDDDAQWNVTPKDNPEMFKKAPARKFDADISVEDDAKWLATCLTDKSFPLANPKASGE